MFVFLFWKGFAGNSSVRLGSLDTVQQRNSRRKRERDRKDNTKKAWKMTKDRRNTQRQLFGSFTPDFSVSLAPHTFQHVALFDANVVKKTSGEKDWEEKKQNTRVSFSLKGKKCCFFFSRRWHCASQQTQQSVCHGYTVAKRVFVEPTKETRKHRPPPLKKKKLHHFKYTKGQEMTKNKINKLTVEWNIQISSPRSSHILQKPETEVSVNSTSPSSPPLSSSPRPPLVSANASIFSLLPSSWLLYRRRLMHSG